MNPELKQKWCEALRSGEYKQGGGWLCKDGKYCCLGVLMEVAMKSGLPITKTEYSDFCDYGNSSFCSAGIPADCYEILGLNSEFPETKLWFLNDLSRQSFAQIADWIEKNL